MKEKSIGLWIILLFLLLGIGYTGYSIFNDNSYKLKFDANGGSNVSSLIIKADSKLDKLPISVREGYNFQGWYLNGKLFDLESEIKGDITLTAVWTEQQENKCVVEFETLGGNGINPLEINCGDTFPNIEKPTKEGYDFQGWYYHNKIVNENTLVNEDMIVVAKWKKVSS